MRVATDAEIFVGLDKYANPVFLDLQDDEPHIACSMRTRKGKSTFCRLSGAQILHGGGRVVIFDHVKAGESHGEWCRWDDGTLIPGVELYRTDEEAHHGLVAWRAEQVRRANSAYNRSGEEFQRTLVIFEEGNTGVRQLRRWWTRTRQSSDPGPSPAIEALAGLACAGASARIHELIVAQKLSAAAAGGDDIREQCGIKLLNGCSKRTWTQLVHDGLSYPSDMESLPRGRVYLYDGQLREVQIAQLSNSEAREWATSGLPQPDRAGLPEDLTLPAPRGEPGLATAAGLPPYREDTCQLPSGGAFELPPEQVTLTDAVDLGLFPGMTHRSVRGRRDTDPSFPAPVGRGLRGAALYHWVDLMTWHETHQPD